jgi:hypothetical protein
VGFTDANVPQRWNQVLVGIVAPTAIPPDPSVLLRKISRSPKEKYLTDTQSTAPVPPHVKKGDTDGNESTLNAAQTLQSLYAPTLATGADSTAPHDSVYAFDTKLLHPEGDGVATTPETESTYEVVRGKLSRSPWDTTEEEEELDDEEDDEEEGKLLDEEDGVRLLDEDEDQTLDEDEENGGVLLPPGDSVPANEAVEDDEEERTWFVAGGDDCWNGGRCSTYRTTSATTVSTNTNHNPTIAAQPRGVMCAAEVWVSRW